MKPKTGTEVVAAWAIVYPLKADLAERIDSNTALAVAEATKDLEECHVEDNRVINHLTQELELCKAHNLMLSDKLKIIGSAELPWSLQDVQELVHATKETIEAYRNEIVQKAKSEQRESDAQVCASYHDSSAASYALRIRNNKGE